MKVTNIILQPDRQFRMVKMAIDHHSADQALSQDRLDESYLVDGGKAIKWRPIVEYVHTWEDLLTLPDLEEIKVRPISKWSWLTGANPFMILTASGNPFPIADKPGKALDYETAREQYTKAKQAAIQSRATGQAAKQVTNNITLGVLAAICVIGTVIICLALMPQILEFMK